jgi:hypothetical protein
MIDKPDPKPKARALSGLDQIQAACGIIFIKVCWKVLPETI